MYVQEVLLILVQRLTINHRQVFLAIQFIKKASKLKLKIHMQLNNVFYRYKHIYYIRRPMIWLYYSYMAWFCMLYHNKRHRLYRYLKVLEQTLCSQQRILIRNIDSLIKRTRLKFQGPGLRKVNDNMLKPLALTQYIGFFYRTQPADWLGYIV